METNHTWLRKIAWGDLNENENYEMKKRYYLVDLLGWRDGSINVIPGHFAGPADFLALPPHRHTRTVDHYIPSLSAFGEKTVKEWISQTKGSSIGNCRDRLSPTITTIIINLSIEKIRMNVRKITRHQRR